MIGFQLLLESLAMFMAFILLHVTGAQLFCSHHTAWLSCGWLAAWLWGTSACELSLAIHV